MILRFAGVGSAFASEEFFQTNAVLTHDSMSQHLLIDCGSDARFSLAKLGINIKDIKDVYISHLHADHAGGLEWLGFCTYFNQSMVRPVLRAVSELMPELWYSTLRGGMESLQGKVASLETFFELAPVRPNESFEWYRAVFSPVQTVHVVSGRKISHSYGLLISFPGEADGTKRTVFYTGDTQFCPHQILEYYKQADVIFQDCETARFPSGVHAHFDDLKTLPADIKAKMWLMHYQHDGKITDKEAAKEGFLGFVKRGQEFVF